MTTSEALSSRGAEESHLCLECGLCCQGILYDHVKLRPAEVPAVRRLGLPIVETDTGPTFPQPCLRHQGDRCTVYAERPSACRLYRCKLLKRHEMGELTWEESSQRVRQAKELVASLLRRLEPEGSATDLWKGVQSLSNEGLAATPEHRKLLLDAAVLRVVLQTHFDDLEC